MAHAILGYNGNCRYIHGHSYQLHVTVAARAAVDDYLPAPGILIDFKDLKRLVKEHLIDKFDHQLVLSRNYIESYNLHIPKENLILFEAEPTAENLLLFFKKEIEKILPNSVQLISLRLYETATSYAEWHV